MAFSLLPQSFDEVKDYIINKIADNYPSIGAFLDNSFLMIFVDVIAWAIALFMDYADNLWNENHLFSTVKFENARRQAKFYGYEAHRKISAQGTIKVGMTSSFNTLPLESITFNQYDRLLINGNAYLVKDAVTFSSNPSDDSYAGLPAGTYYVTVNVIQGELITRNETASGSQSETFIVNDASVENSVFINEVNSSAYTKVNSFFTSSATDTHYLLENLAHMSGVKVTYGNDYRGIKLSSGDSIVLKYIRTSDLSGQIKSVGFNVIFQESYQYSDTTPVAFYGITTSQMLGASGVESLESIKYWGQIAASAVDEKAFNDDEVRLALQEFGGILKSKALSEYDISPNTPDQTSMNTVRLLVVPTSGTSIDDVTKQRIRNYLRPKMDFTDFIEFLDVVYIDVRFVIDAEVNQNTPQDFSAQVGSYLQTTYALGERDFGASLDHSTLITQIKTEFSDYIRRFNLTLWVVEDETSPTIPTGGIITKTLKIGGLRSGQNNIKGLQIVTNFRISSDIDETWEDDGSGNLILAGGQFLTAGTINYETGAISLTLNGSVTQINSLLYRYTTYDVDGKDVNIDIKYNQIAQYQSHVVEVEYI